ncbi:MAG: EAL domain-containing protein [Gammaproteobacteria bacterium]|nr:EAL domain-containing protein [Gammaproteobacteria bacterium]
MSLLVFPGLTLASQTSQTVNGLASLNISLTNAEKEYLENLPTLRVPLLTDQPPLSFIENQQPAGYLNTLFEYVASSLNLKYKRDTNYSFSSAIRALQNREVDLLNDYSSTRKKRASILHTKPVLTIPFVAVGHAAEDDSIRSVKSLQQKTLVMVTGFQQTKTIQQRYPHLKMILVDSIDQAYRKLRNKEADYYIDNATHAGYYLNSQMISDLKIVGEFSAEETGVLELRFAIGSNRPLLHSAIEKALNAIDYGDIQKLRNQWMNNMSTKVTLQLTEAEQKWLDDHPEIRLASDNAWLPFETINKKGEHIGIAADYMQLIEQRLGINFITSPVKPWKDITEMVKNRELDLFSCAMETETRTLYAQFTKPYVNNPMVIATKDTVGYVDGLKGLLEKTIAIENGYASHDLLRTKHPELQLQPHTDTLSSVLAVSKGQAFAYIGTIANLSHMLRTHGITNIRISGQVPYSFDLSMGVRSDWPELVPILQKALDSISLQEKNTILQKWIGIDIDQELDYSLVWQIAGIVLFLFLSILYWNLLLNKKVRDRTSQLQHQAQFDALTDLPNRVLAFDRLSQLILKSQRSGKLSALLFLDLDDFKKINDTMGHDVGDFLLIEAANRLRNTLRNNDTVARLGGDEFIIICGDLEQANDVGPLAKNLINKFREAFIHDGRELRVTASIGIAIYPNDGETPTQLLQNADIAMYHSKQQGRNTYSYFNDTMNEEVTRRLLLEEHMHSALNNGEFSLLYQPKININKPEVMEVMGVEALLRWHNPVLGEISPLEFIPIAEHNGLIIPIGQFVFTQALEVTEKWQLQFDHSFNIAINMSPQQFRDPKLIEFITNAIDQSAVSRESLEMEITEGVLMSGLCEIEDALTTLKNLGISIAMDDFGTGYSSLSYLRKYPFDVLKIDREFINDIFTDKSDQELVIATISMAHALGLKVVAEGVETKEQLEFLVSKGCDLAQGYYFSKAVSDQEITHILSDQKVFFNKLKVAV